ncbi:hypothetical protein ASG89_25880 [Paenibacillus sp. Soil766]|uniref:hypothetical protein n=1 Tax=Paenibacillus sp. Soil766 TaxID=1736404 RepID=UPI00070B93BC|nr:hypothetical protein [Paenibacillus sp. Soil766]KRF01043.1 hypothetical protein ASG89_25880 [Paenibacillus sp. Soil766]
MELIETYKRYRQNQVGIHTKVLDNHVHAGEIKESAKILGILNKDRVVLESSAEQDAVYDFNVYTKIRSGKSSLAEFVDVYSPKSNDEEKLLSAMLESHVSLYEVLEIHKEEGTLLITDILSGARNPIKLVDLSLSKSMSNNVLLCTRLIDLGEFSMTSGLGFMFSANHKDFIMKRTQKMLKKMQTGDLMTDRFIVFFNLNRSDGIQVFFEDVK